MNRNLRIGRSLSPIPFDRYQNIQQNLRDGEYAVIHQAPPHNALVPYQPPQHHYLRNALIGGVGLGAGIGAMYHYREPLMKLGQRAFNYARDKFHNLFQPSNNTATNQNPHNW